MGDPFSALSATCAALQFLEFGAKFIGKTYKVYKSTDGAVADVSELDWAARRFKTAAHAHDAQALRSQSATEAEQELLALCGKCEAFADSVIEELKPLKTSGKSGLRSSVKVVLKTGRRKDELHAKEKRLEALRAEMNTQLIKVLGDRQAGCARALADLQTQDRALESSISGNLETLRLDLLSKIDDQHRKQSAVDIPPLLTKLVTEAKDAKVKQNLLQSLHYKGMGTRKDNISHTYADTFEWILDPDEDRGLSTHLQDWLENGKGIFWVSGKPGSGKSTLMKFIDRHARTEELLHEWAAGSKLVRASHYFWINGSDIQKSQVGLLREICAAIAKECPEVLLQVLGNPTGTSGNRWSDLPSHVEWSTPMLRRILDEIQNATFRQGVLVRFAFFIDGLDEYAGDHEDLIDMLQHLATPQNVKVCVASRPWNVFERAFGDRDDKKIYMQDLTQADISTFVRNKLTNDDLFQDLKQHDPKGAEHIVRDIIGRADGVFLWVHLVVRQIRKSLVNGDCVETLRDRVYHMPSDLDAYFRLIFDNLETFYRRDTARIFLSCLESAEELPLLGFKVILQKHTVNADGMDQEGQLEFQIRARAQDLVEINEYEGIKKVSFIHRSVTDFLRLPDISSLMETWAGPDFDTHQTLCEAFVLACEQCDFTIDSGAADFRYFTFFACEQARQIKRAQQRYPMAELKRLEGIVETPPAVLKEYFAPIHFEGFESYFIPLALQAGLGPFLEMQPAILRAGAQALLGFACRERVEYFLGSPASPAVIELLLQYGGDPNGLCFGLEHDAAVSIWMRFLHELCNDVEERLTVLETDGKEICELLIKAGARFPSASDHGNTKAVEDLFGKTLSERDILEQLFGELETDRLLSLRPVDVEGDSQVKTIDKRDVADERKHSVFSRLISVFMTPSG